MDATAEQMAAFSAALLQALADHIRADVRAEVERICGESVSKAALQQYLAGDNEPSRQKVWAFEKAMKLPPGTLSRCLGYLPLDAAMALSPEDVIGQDTSLPRKVRDALIEAVRAGRRR